MGWVDVPFDIPNLRAENGMAQGHVRVGWLRSVANIPHAFAVHSFIDELAVAAGRDRVEYLLAALGSDRIIGARPGSRPNPKYPLDTARFKRVVQMVADQSGWGKKKSGNGHGWGIAVHRSFLTYVATRRGSGSGQPGPYPNSACRYSCGRRSDCQSRARAGSV